MSTLIKEQTPAHGLADEILGCVRDGTIDPHEIADRIWWKHGRAFTAPELMTEEQVRAVILELCRRTLNRRNRQVRRLPSLGWGVNREGADTTVAENHARNVGPAVSRIAASWLDQTLAVPDSDGDHARYVLWGDATAADWDAVAEAYGGLERANGRERKRCEEYAATLRRRHAGSIRTLPQSEQERLRELAEAD